MGFGADSFDGARRRVERDDRRLVEDDAVAAREDAGVGRPEVDGKIAGKEGKNRPKVQCNSLGVSIRAAFPKVPGIERARQRPAGALGFTRNPYTTRPAQGCDMPLDVSAAVIHRQCQRGPEEMIDR